MMLMSYKMNPLFPTITPFQHFHIAVDQEHTLYVEQCGNPNGVPILFLHGGPGAGCSEDSRRFFDPQKFHIILFDQRGCGRSTPHGSLNNNETNFLIEDIEHIRNYLAIDTWHIFGGSWGSTLSLLYAQAYPKQVRSLTLRGIFLSRQKDTNWAFNHGGGSRIFPDHWQAYMAMLPNNHPTLSIPQQAYAIMLGKDEVLAQKVARAWAEWENQCSTLEPNNAPMTDKEAWTLGRHEAHYLSQGCFLRENQILDNCDTITHIPTTIVHGRYDIICPFDNAFLLHQALPQSTLVVSQKAGHSATEKEAIHHLIQATNALVEN